MRLKRLHLRHYGCFEDLQLELAAEPGRITLITAPNGSGKSVLRRAFHDLLFDIPLQSPMKFRHGYPGMALHAEAVDGGGAAFSFGWERGSKPPRVTNDPMRFNALRNGVTPQQLERLFALDTERLRRGGVDLKGGATLSAALLAGTGELASAKSVRAALEARRQQNWGPGKSKPPLNAAAARLDAARKRSRETMERPEKRDREERELAERERALAEARGLRDLAAAETRRLNRIALTRPHLVALGEAEAWLLAHADAPALPAGLDAALAEARAGVALAQAKDEHAAKARDDAAGAAGRIVRDPVCMQVADRLAGLPGQLGAAEKAAKDSAQLRADRAARLDGVRAGLRAIGSDLPVERAGEAVPVLGLKAEVQAAITEEAGLRAGLGLAREGVAKARAALVKAEGDVRGADPLPERLPALLAEMRADRNPVLHAEETAAVAQAGAAEVRRVLALMPGWRGTAEALRDVPVAAETAFERLDGARRSAEAGAQAASRHREALEAQDAAARAALAVLQERALPDAASLAAARALRDRGMRLVLRRAFGMAPSAAEEAEYAGEEPVALAYERQVRAADALADRRVDELKQVQEAERLVREVGGLEEALRGAVADDAGALEALGVARGAWTAAVAPIGLGTEATMAELRQACEVRRRLVDVLAAHEVAMEAQAALVRRHAGWAERLAGTMGEVPAPLAALLVQADQRVKLAEAAEKAGVKRQAAIDAAQRALPEALEAQDRAERAVAIWQEGWGRLLARLHRPTDESPAAVAAVLDGIAALERDHREAVSLGQRLDGMQADLAVFAALVAGLADEAGQAAGASAAETARGLMARMKDASAAEAAWQQAEVALAGAVAAAERARAELGKAKARLGAVVASCGAATAEEAEARIAASRAHADQVARRDAARQKLAEHGDGMADTVLRGEADSVPAGEMAARRQAAEDDAGAAQSRAEGAAVALNALSALLETASASTDAVDARADYEAAISEFDRLLEDQLVLHLASTMLGEAMQTVEEGLGGSSLARASQAFSAVTGGAYGLVRHDGPEGEELFAVERAFPGERKGLDELSEGTRDQLYLALRMQALREHCAAATPLPFIADDILQTFDDDRALAALGALCELSAELQVIVLTHHPHVQAIAARVGAGVVQCLALPG